MADSVAESGNKVFMSSLEGTLLRDTSFFPYYMLVALEAGGPLRALLLLLLYPITLLLLICISEAAAIKLQIFVTTAGLKMSDVKAVSRGVLPKFFLDDLDPAAYRAFLSLARTFCSSRRCVVTSHPKLFVEHFLQYFLQVDYHDMLATELQITRNGMCTGFVCTSGVLDDAKKTQAVKLLFHDSSTRLYGLCIKGMKQPGFLSRCQEVISVMQSKSGERVSKDEYVTPLIFHDGRLVMRPTPFVSLAMVLWTPIGLTLAVMRMVSGLTLPQELAYPIISFLGIRLRVRGAPPLLQSGKKLKEGVLFVCVHRTLADPTFLTMAMRREVRALIYKVSKISEFLSPMKTTRLSRNREEDAKVIDKLLDREDLFVCPEGTTCREPYLLRFSPLFADLADRIVPVAVRVKMTVFHGTSARGYKFLDGFFLAMNPSPMYEVIFLEPMSIRELRERGMSAIEIANLVQRKLGDELGYTCTNYNRRDKYLLLAGHDGNLK